MNPTMSGKKVSVAGTIIGQKTFSRCNTLTLNIDIRKTSLLKILTCLLGNHTWTETEHLGLPAEYKRSSDRALYFCTYIIRRIWSTHAGGTNWTLVNSSQIFPLSSTVTLRADTKNSIEQ
eukprot:GHVL01041491.1.p1 GENE.GHVL01041491.1~~GHVL01041491.1.p1  ORF type:complete len:120 (-),score=3.06 GHVL01041491.1:523-882(-)